VICAKPRLRAARSNAFRLAAEEIGAVLSEYAYDLFDKILRRVTLLVGRRGDYIKTNQTTKG